VESSLRSISRRTVGIVIASTAIAGLLNLVFRPNETLLGIAPHADGGIAGIQQTNHSERSGDFHTGILIIRQSDAINKNVFSWCK